MTDKAGVSALMHSVGSHMTYVSLKLLSWPTLNVAAVDGDGRTVLVYLVAHDRVDEALMLLKRSSLPLPNDHAFAWAIDNGYEAVFIALLKVPNAADLLQTHDALERLLLAAVHGDLERDAKRKAAFGRMFAAAAATAGRETTTRVLSIVLEVCSLALEFV